MSSMSLIAPSTKKNVISKSLTKNAVNLLIKNALPTNKEIIHDMEARKITILNLVKTKGKFTSMKQETIKAMIPLFFGKLENFNLLDQGTSTWQFISLTTILMTKSS